MSGLELVHQVLSGASTVVALAGDRISPLERKDYIYPAVVLTGSYAPANALKGRSDIDHCTVTVNYWDTTYAGAHTLAAAGRAALEAAGLPVESESDEFTPIASLAGLVCVTQTVSFWA